MSDRENWFKHYLDELQEHEYISEYKQQFPTFDLLKPIKIDLKGCKSSHTLTRKSSITPDFTIYWTDKALNLLYSDFNKENCDLKYFKTFGNISYVDVKPLNEKFNISSSYSFTEKQKLLLSNTINTDTPIYIQKIYVEKYGTKKELLFESTFYPDILYSKRKNKDNICNILIYNEKNSNN